MSGTLAVRGVVEPYPWPVTATVVSAAYPGSFRLQNAGGSAGITFGPGAADAPPLRGIDGRFAGAGGQLTFDPTGGTFLVVAGSLLAAEARKSRRDQRGLTLKETVRSAAAIRTDLEFEAEPGVIQRTTLCTLRQPVGLSLGPLAGQAAASWVLWFRDLPAAPSGGTLTFDRPATGSPFREGVNDPEAAGRAYNHRNGYEWRLGGPDAGSLGPLDFYPLTLERVTFAADDTVASVVLTGRLQLPVPNLGEQSDQSNAVRLTFSSGRGGALVLTDLAVEPADPDLPLAGQTAPTDLIWPLTAALGGPRLRIARLWLTGDGKLELRDVRLELSMYGEPWTAAFPGTQVIEESTTEITLLRDYGDPSAPVAITSLRCVLRLTPTAAAGHEVDVTLRGRWGQPGEIQVEALARWGLLRPEALPETTRVRLFAGGGTPADLLFDPPGTDNQLPQRAFQVRWRGVQWLGPSRPQLLPGFVATGPDTPGYAVITFRVAAAATPADPPAFALEAGFVEVLFPCRWGESLQDLAGTLNPPTSAVFGSSAGCVDGGLTALGPGCRPLGHRTPAQRRAGGQEPRVVARTRGGSRRQRPAALRVSAHPPRRQHAPVPLPPHGPGAAQPSVPRGREPPARRGRRGLPARGRRGRLVPVPRRGRTPTRARDTRRRCYDAG